MSCLALCCVASRPVMDQTQENSFCRVSSREKSHVSFCHDRMISTILDGAVQAGYARVGRKIVNSSVQEQAPRIRPIFVALFGYRPLVVPVFLILFFLTALGMSFLHFFLSPPALLSFLPCRYAKEPRKLAQKEDPLISQIVRSHLP